MPVAYRVAIIVPCFRFRVVSRIGDRTENGRQLYVPLGRHDLLVKPPLLQNADVVGQTVQRMRYNFESFLPRSYGVATPRSVTVAMVMQRFPSVVPELCRLPRGCLKLPTPRFVQVLSDK